MAKVSKYSLILFAVQCRSGLLVNPLMLECSANKGRRIKYRTETKKKEKKISWLKTESLVLYFVCFLFVSSLHTIEELPIFDGIDDCIVPRNVSPQSIDLWVDGSLSSRVTFEGERHQRSYGGCGDEDGLWRDLKCYAIRSAGRRRREGVLAIERSENRREKKSG